MSHVQMTMKERVLCLSLIHILWSSRATNWRWMEMKSKHKNFWSFFWRVGAGFLAFYLAVMGVFTYVTAQRKPVSYTHLDVYKRQI